MWDKVGDKMMSAIIRMNISMDELPWVDGRLNVVELLRLYKKGKQCEEDDASKD